MSLLVLDIDLTAKNVIKELGLFSDGSLQGFSFCPPKIFIPKKQTRWNIQGIAWSIGKLGYEKLFAVFYDIKLMNSEVCAKRFEKCRPLTRILGQYVENLDDYSCPKIQDLNGEGKANSSWICSCFTFPTQNKASLCREKSKGVWRLGNATFKFVNSVRLYCNWL